MLLLPALRCEVQSLYYGSSGEGTCLLSVSCGNSLGSRRVCRSPFKFCPSPHFGAHLKHRFQKGLENGAEEDATKNSGSGILMGHGLKYLPHTVPPDLLLLAGLLGSHSPFMSLV